MAQPGRTGLFANLSCAYAGATTDTEVALLSPFGAFTVGSGCAARQHVVDAGVLAGVEEPRKERR